MPRRDEAPPGCSLLVRNLARSIRADDLKYVAEKYGRIRDIYLPKDFYTGEPRGIGFLEYTDLRDAEDAREGLDRAIISNREISVVFAQQGRKQPNDYRARDRRDGGGYGYGGRSYGGGYSRRRSYSPRRRSYSPRRRSGSPRRRSPSRSLSRGRSRSPRHRRSTRRSASYSRSRSADKHSRSRSKSVPKSKSPQGSRSRSPRSVSKERSKSRPISASPISNDPASPGRG